MRVAAAIVQQLAEAMQYSHTRGILHRDLKPSNVLLFPLTVTSQNGAALPFVPRIVDFGLAHLAEEGIDATSTSAVIGTPLYMSPEQAMGKERVGPAADLYALGVILYELLCGQPPFVGTVPLEVLAQVWHMEPPRIRKKRKDVSRDLETICLRCLQKRPTERYPTAKALAEDLKRFLEGQPIVARPISTLARCYRWCQQPQRLREAGLTVMAVNFVTGGWTFVTAMSFAWGLLERPENMTAAEVYRDALPIVLVVHIPQVLAGLLIMREKKWAVQFALSCGLGMWIVATLLSFNFFANPFSSLWKDKPGFSMLMFSMMAMLFILQSVACGIAAIALRAVNLSKVTRPL
jgi:hypothetical protein